MFLEDGVQCLPRVQSFQQVDDLFVLDPFGQVGADIFRVVSHVRRNGTHLLKGGLGGLLLAARQQKSTGG